MTELRLPFPVSVNEMYVNRNGRGRNRYPSPEFKAWTTEAGIELNLQKPRKFEGRVIIDIDLDESRQGDCDSRTKCVVDLLVKHKVIVDDRKKFVQRVSIGWAAISGCRVRIAEVA
jgi:Holliday junction resolvase RusA-like endonuclease